MTVATHTEPAYRVFDTRVRTVSALSPNFLLITLVGEELDAFDDCGDDQRFKLVLPLADGGLDSFPRSADWYGDWRHLPPHRQNPIRTYTVSAVRPAAREIDVVVVRHGATGPASAWAETAAPGAPVLVVGPNARCEGPTRAAEWAPPRGATVLLAGDETAAPAIVAILAGMAPAARGRAVIEVPTSADSLPVRGPAGVTVSWLGRDGRTHGSLLDAAVRAGAAELLGGLAEPAPPTAASVAGDESDDDVELPWEVATDPAAGFYAWLAGEAGTIRSLRRHLVRDVGVDRRAVTFMGYWKLGAAEQN